MKPLKADQQLRSVSLAYSVALQASKPKSSPRRRRGLDASTDRGLTERSGEVFVLDILSHRMSVIAMFQQLPLIRIKQGFVFHAGSPTFRTSSAKRGSERMESSKKSVFNPIRPSSCS